LPREAAGWGSLVADPPLCGNHSQTGAGKAEPL